MREFFDKTKPVLKVTECLIDNDGKIQFNFIL